MFTQIYLKPRLVFLCLKPSSGFPSYSEENPTSSMALKGITIRQPPPRPPCHSLTSAPAPLTPIPHNSLACFQQHWPFAPLASGQDKIALRYLKWDTLGLLFSDHVNSGKVASSHGACSLFFKWACHYLHYRLPWGLNEIGNIMQLAQYLAFCWPYTKKWGYWSDRWG